MNKAMKPILLAVGMMTLALTTSPAMAAVPATVEVHGALLSAGGGPAADGDYSMTFAVYDKAINGKSGWLEGPVKVAVIAGRFVHQLGTLVPLKASLINGATASWLGVAVGADPELPRTALHSVFYARRAQLAEGLACSGCVGGSQLAAGAITGNHLAADAVTAGQVAFPYAGAKTKAGPATKALDLDCSGCVSVGELKLDGELNLGGNGLKAKKIAADEVAAAQVSASSFIGDGSQLTGVKMAASSCSKAGEVVKGIDQAGKLICVAAMNPAGLPSDGLDEISGGLLTNEFVHSASLAKPAPIPDNNPTGIGVELNFPNVGKAKKLTVHLALSNSNIANVRVTLFDPNNGQYVLYNKGGTGKKLAGGWPDPDATLSGDLSTWIGKNPKGIWRLAVVDDKGVNDVNDGQIDSWSLSMQTVSNQQVEATKGLLVSGLLKANGGLLYKTATKAPVTCNAAMTGYTYLDTALKALRICNGSDFYSLFLVNPGTKGNPAANCKDLLTQLPLSKSGAYWLDVDGVVGPAAPFKTWCDMVTDGGGWTLLGTVAGGDKDNWNTQYGYWADTKLLGSAAQPWLDFKSGAWVSMNISQAEILFQRRYDGSVRAQTKLASACQGGKATFRGLFSKWDTSIKCGTGSLTPILKPGNNDGVSGASYVEGGADGMGGSSTNGFCWNGGDNNGNTFKGHAGWNQKGYGCLDSGHLGYIGVWQKGDNQYSQKDIDTTNWLHNTTVGKTEISFFAR